MDDDDPLDLNARLAVIEICMVQLLATHFSALPDPAGQLEQLDAGMLGGLPAIGRHAPAGATAPGSQTSPATRASLKAEELERVDRAWQALMGRVRTALSDLDDP
jgi:hypothetical protein